MWLNSTIQRSQELYSKYSNKDFEILAFPCNQFGAQEPGSNEEIKEFCDINFNVSFKIFDKINVNGSSASPLFKHLKNEAKGVMGSEAIKWNFTKFLIDNNGSVIKGIHHKLLQIRLTKISQKYWIN